ncbi:hypothetical protein ACEWY4_000245 [Coilia grayii]|uniref:guanylate cyclase n=1 Tax=Coilia grayii TaxID=363190 RepID=A0ABD1KW56_9TELE
MDFNTHTAAWRASEASLGELTSCRTNATLRLVTELQNMRNVCMSELIGTNTAHNICASPSTVLAHQMTQTYWVEVLSLRLLVTFRELVHQLLDSHQIGDQQGFQHKWWSTLNSLASAKLMSENLDRCWARHMDVEPNSLFLLEVLHNLLSSNSSWGVLGVLDSTRGTQECFVEEAAGSLRLRSRDLLSSLSLKLCLLSLACLIYPAVLFSFKQMTEWIQNYASSLRERTEDLKRERRLAEDLLHQMLPRSVVKQLRQRQHVEAESYEQVTIFFSDIVGFTAISASCTPLQVVEMLNNLYMCFDTRIDSYDVYKVETIGDAYMVVSGLPERNGDRHADEIAKMSLDLVAAVRQVPIPHMPNKRLQLRAGIHTGPCVAGIVGYKMPRYCLFGDTVNTASRMESTSLPQKIHASSATYQALLKDNAYELQLRGEVEVKGKGKMNTYWLVGHKNFSVQNDSLVCHWNPSLSRKKKTPVGSSISMANSSLTIQSVSESTTPISQLEAPLSHNAQQQGSEVTLCVSAQVENCAGSFGTLGSMVGCLGEETPRNSPLKMDNKTDLLPGAVQTT